MFTHFLLRVVCIKYLLLIHKFCCPCFCPQFSAMTLHISGGTGGDDLTTSGIEPHPGPGSFPPAYYEPSTTEHDKWQMTTCVVCFTRISQSEWSKAVSERRQLYLRDNPTALERLTEERFLPEFNLQMNFMPHALHLKCLKIILHKRSPPSSSRGNCTAAHRRSNSKHLCYRTSLH